ncbi:unnamed protein product, partial [Didymodactylos carnosus]
MDYTQFNYIDRAKISGYVRNVSFNFYTAPSGNNLSQIWLYLVDDDTLVSGYPMLFNLSSPYLIPPVQIQNKSGVQQFTLTPYAMNISQGQFLAVSFSASTGGSTYENTRNLYALANENLLPDIMSGNPYEFDNYVSYGMAFSYTVMAYS